MAHVAFDTLKFMEKLKAAGVSEAEAKAFSEAANEAFSEALDSTLATKQDLFELRDELKSDNLRLRDEMKSEINRLDKGLIQVRGELYLVKWMQSFVLAGIAALILKAFF